MVGPTIQLFLKENFIQSFDAYKLYQPNEDRCITQPYPVAQRRGNLEDCQSCRGGRIPT